MPIRWRVRASRSSARRGRPTSTTARARFLARHPAAAGYADFPDFSFYAFDITSAHFIGGFGRIVDLPRDDLLIDVAGAEALSEREDDIVGHMNEDHADAIELYATRLLGAAPGAWRMTGIDPEGCDLVLGARALRLPFDTRITTARKRARSSSASSASPAPKPLSYRGWEHPSRHSTGAA